MATKKYGYNQYKPDGPAGMDVVDAELNRYSPAFDYLSGFVTRSKLKQVDDDRTGTSTGGGSTGGGSTGGGSSTVTNTFNPTVNVTGGTQTQQTQAAGGDIVDSGQTNTATTTSTTTATNTVTGGGNGGGGNGGGGNGGGGTQTCPAGKVGTPPNCTDPVAASCPDGKVGTPPNCTDPVAASCPDGKVGTPPNCTDPVVNKTRFSTDFATEQDAKNYISGFYENKDVLGRAANFGTTSDDTDASYWLNKFASDNLSKSDFESNVKLSSEFDKREDLKTAYTDSGRAATEQELDAMMGTDTAANTANTAFLTNYASKIADTSDSSKSETEKDVAKNFELDAALTKDATTGAYDTSTLTAAEATKFSGLSDAVKNVYAQNLTAGDLTKTTTQGGVTSSIDKAIHDAYKLLGPNRKPDSEGYDYWAKQLKLDPTFDLASSFKLSNEYKMKNPT